MASMTKGRIRSLRMTLFSTHDGRYPYNDSKEVEALQKMGYLDDTKRITVTGAMVVLSNAASNQIPWVAVEETTRALNEIKIMFSNELQPKG